MKHLKNKIQTKIGILGGGQLAKMLYESASMLGISTLIYGQSAEDPAVKIAAHSILGSFSGKIQLERFIKSVDIVLFENEFIDLAPIKILANKFPRVSFVPDLQTFERIRDKSQQKITLKNLKVPTANFELYDYSISIQKWLTKLNNNFKSGYVIKLGLGGYDGKGLIFSTQNESVLISFCENAIKLNQPFYAEERIKIKNEVALVSVYSVNQEWNCYPLVVSIQKEGICRSVMGPANLFGINSKHENMAKKISRQLVRKLNIYGIYAIEFFVTHDDRLLVNEISPRVHNSGHFTQNASPTSQFENHLRATLGIPLGSTQTTAVFGMLNLLWPKNDKSCDIRFPDLQKNQHFHWYGKSEMKILRKVGHVNFQSPLKSDCKKLLKDINLWEKKWKKI